MTPRQRNIGLRDARTTHAMNEDVYAVFIPLPQPQSRGGFGLRVNATVLGMVSMRMDRASLERRLIHHAVADAIANGADCRGN